MAGPAYHARTHLPGGTDPLNLFATDIPVGNYSEIVLASSDLRGYWRLGEAAAPFLDTSGYHLTLPGNLTKNTNGTAMTLDATGALPATYDDGAIVQNYAGTTGSGNSAADWLQGSNGGDGRWNFTPSDPTENMSVAAWINPTASANTWSGGIVSAMNTVVGSPSYDGGWALYMDWPGRTVVFWRGGAGPTSQAATSGAVTAGTWVHAAATYDGTNIRLYLDGALVATTASSVNLPTMNESATVGNFAPALGTYRGRFYGSIDEAAVWSKTLTPTEVATLAAAGVTAATTIEAGWVLTADGSGGSDWAAPTIEVDY